MRHLPIISLNLRHLGHSSRTRAICASDRPQCTKYRWRINKAPHNPVAHLIRPLRNVPSVAGKDMDKIHSGDSKYGVVTTIFYSARQSLPTSTTSCISFRSLIRDDDPGKGHKLTINLAFLDRSPPIHTLQFSHVCEFARPHMAKIYIKKPCLGHHISPPNAISCCLFPTHVQSKL
jgi:hypothetical protein